LNALRQGIDTKVCALEGYCVRGADWTAAKLPQGLRPGFEKVRPYLDPVAGARFVGTKMSESPALNGALSIGTGVANLKVVGPAIMGAVGGPPGVALTVVATNALDNGVRVTAIVAKKYREVKRQHPEQTRRQNLHLAVGELDREYREFAGAQQRRALRQLGAERSADQQQ